jgi:hypothetical protein
MTSVRIQRLCAWCGPALIVLFFIGFILIARLLPAVSPTDTADQIAELYSARTNAIRLGVLIAMFGWTLIGPWGISIVTLTRGRTNGARAMNNLQVACAGAAIADVVITLLIFGVASYRPDQYSPDTIRMLNDFAWFMFLFSVPPFSLWMAAIGLAILADDTTQPAFPRWAGFFNFWTALVILPAGLIVFFKVGPFAFNGVLALYMPLTVFFIWICTMTHLVLRAVRREEREVLRATEPVGETEPVSVDS